MRHDGGSSDSLPWKVDAVVELMADRSIDELPDAEFAEDAGTARSFAETRAETWGGGKVDEVPGGYRVTVPTQDTSGDGTDPGRVYFALTPASPQWKGFHAKYTEELRPIRGCVDDLEPSRYDLPVNAMTTVYSALQQQELFTGAEEKALATRQPEIEVRPEGQVPVWSNAEQMSSDVSSWDGQFISALSNVYLDQLPQIVRGQFAVAGYLLGSLQVSRLAVSRAELFTGELLSGAITALEEAAPGGGGDFSFSATLDVISKTTGFISAVAALIPGAQGFAGGIALTSTVTGLTGEVAGKYESGPREPEKKYITGDTVEEIAESLEREIRICLNQVADSENAWAKTLAELSDIVERNNVVNSNVPTAIPLTSRDAFFRPKPVTGGGGDQRLPGDSDIATLVVDDVDKLAVMGSQSFPLLADEYRSMTDDLDTVDAATLSDAMVRRTIGEASDLYGEWLTVHGHITRLFAESATNLDDVGRVVVGAAEAISGTDQANGTTIDASTRELMEA